MLSSWGERTRMCLRKRSGYRPPDLINAKIVSIWSAALTSLRTGRWGWERGGVRRGGGAAFSLISPSPVSSRRQGFSALRAVEEKVGLRDSFPPLPFCPSFLTPPPLSSPLLSPSWFLLECIHSSPVISAEKGLEGDVFPPRHDFTFIPRVFATCVFQSHL